MIEIDFRIEPKDLKKKLKLFWELSGEKIMLRAARATCDFYIENTPVDGIPYWDTGAPNLHKLGDYLNRPADPFNPWEPVDSSAAAIGSQGLLRLGKYLIEKGEKEGIFQTPVYKFIDF